MKLNIFADIHGNIDAFRKVWEAMHAEGCDRYCFLGDVCGYYYHQNEIIDMLRVEKDMLAVRGNHDDLFLKMINNDVLEQTYTEKYGQSCRRLKQEIKQDNLRFIEDMPDHSYMRKERMGFFHGSPWNYMQEYIYPDSDMQRFKDVALDFIFMAHTHYPFLLEKWGKLIVNVGSVGQSRVEGGFANWVCVDTKDKNVKINSIAYDVSRLAREVEEIDQHVPYLREVLFRKKGDRNAVG